MSTASGSTLGEFKQVETHSDHAPGTEFAPTPVPAKAGRSMFSVTLVGIGFPMIIAGAMTGSVLVLGMGVRNALAAMFIANVIMFCCVGARGQPGTWRGYDFALLAGTLSGRKGDVFAS